MVRQSFFRRHWIGFVAVSIGYNVAYRTLDRLFGASMHSHVMYLVVFVATAACTGASGLLLMEITRYLRWGECYLQDDDANCTQPQKEASTVC
jgi:hypothetical protein